MNKEQLNRELARMNTKRDNICIELGAGYDWILVESLIAIDKKIKQYEKKLEQLMAEEERIW